MLNVVADFVSNDIGIGEIASRFHLSLHLLKKGEVDI